LKSNLAIIPPQVPAPRKTVSRAPQMTPALKGERDRILALLARADEDEIRTRYQVGIIITKIKGSEDHYGAHAVAQLAVALERDEATLYRYALVAEAWTPRTLAAILERRMPCGTPLSWSHMVELAGIRSASKRTEMLELVLERGLSVRELTTLLRDATLVEGVRAARAVAKLRRFLVQLETTRTKLRIDDAYVAGIVRVDPADRGETIRLLGAAIQAQRTFQQSVGDWIAALEGAERRLRAQDETEPVGRAPVGIPRIVSGPRLIAGMRG